MISPEDDELKRQGTNLKTRRRYQLLPYCLWSFGLVCCGSWCLAASRKEKQSNASLFTSYCGFFSIATQYIVLSCGQHVDKMFTAQGLFNISRTSQGEINFVKKPLTRFWAIGNAVKLPGNATVT